MPRVSDFVMPPRVVQDCKELYDFYIGTRHLGQLQTVFKHSGPVCHSMIAVQRQHVIFEDRPHNKRNTLVHVGYFASALT